MRHLIHGILAMILISTLRDGMAQDLGTKKSVFVGAGYGQFYDDEGSLGSGPVFRAGAEWRPFRRFALRGEMYGIHHTRTDSFEVSGNSVSAFGSGVYYFMNGTTQPYLSVGLGIQQHDFRYSWPSSPDLGRFHASGNSAAAFLAFGAEMFVNRRWSIVPEFRVVAGREYICAGYFSLAAAYHW
jgi:hypothetical protein